MKFFFVDVEGYGLEISEEKFAQIKEIRKNLFNALEIEEKFNLLLESYAEFEKEILGLAVEKAIFHKDDWSSSIDEIHLMNRRIVNLLTACRLYIDQTSHNVRSIYGKDSGQEKRIKAEKNKAYDSEMQGYRVMEALRNYTQHRDLPIQELSHHWQRIETGKGFFKKHLVTLSIDFNLLKQDPKMKSAIILDLQKLSDNNGLVELTPLIRQYVELIGEVHSETRKMLESDLEEWELVLGSEIDNYKQHFVYKDNIKIVEASSSENIIQEYSIFRNPIQRRQMLEKKTKSINRYSSHFVSNESPKKI